MLFVIYFLSVLLLPGLARAQVTYKFTVDWKINAQASDKSNIYRDGKLVGSVGKGIMTYSDTVTGPAKQNYCWEVTSLVGTKESAKSTPPACKALPDAPAVTKPLTPSGLTVTTESATAIRMSWQNNSVDATEVELRRKTGKPPATKTIAGISPETTLYIDEGLVVSTTYCYQVRAKNTAGISGYSPPSCGTTLAK